MLDWLSKLDPKWTIQNAALYSVLAVVLYFVAFHMILPTQNQQFKTQDNIVTIQKDIATTIANQTPILEDIRRNTSK